MHIHSLVSNNACVFEITPIEITKQQSSSHMNIIKNISNQNRNAKKSGGLSKEALRAKKIFQNHIQLSK